MGDSYTCPLELTLDIIRGTHNIAATGSCFSKIYGCHKTGMENYTKIKLMKNKFKFRLDF